MGPAVRRALQGQDRLVRRRQHDAPDDGLVSRFQGPVEPERRGAQAGAEVPHLQEGPRAHDLVLGDRPVGGVRLR